MKHLQIFVALILGMGGAAHAQQVVTSRCQDGPSRHFELSYAPGDAAAVSILNHYEIINGKYTLYRTFRGLLSETDVSLEGTVSVTYDYDQQLQGEPFAISVSTQGETGPIINQLVSVNGQGPSEVPLEVISADNPLSCVEIETAP